MEPLQASGGTILYGGLGVRGLPRRASRRRSRANARSPRWLNEGADQQGSEGLEGFRVALRSSLRPAALAMHIPDGFLSPQLTLPAWAVAAPLWAWAARRHFGATATESLPVVGSLTALAFVVQSIMIPVPGGTSTHLVGVALLALLYNPRRGLRLRVAGAARPGALLRRRRHHRARRERARHGAPRPGRGLARLPGAARGSPSSGAAFAGRLRRHAGGHAGGGARARAAAPARPGLLPGALRGDLPSP